jgi:anti-anti-sigma regulatory factor
VRDENDFPTVRFRKCGACGNVYTGSLTGDDACPKCHAPFRKEQPLIAAISRTATGGHLAFAINGSIRSLGQLEDLRARIEEALAESPDSIAFAFEGASYLNSSLINLLVKTMQSLSIRGKPTFIVTRDEDTLESMQMMDLDRVMKILPDQESYRAALG